MDDKNYTLEVSAKELHFIQHCIVYAGSCITGNINGAKSSFMILYQTLKDVNPEDLQKRILSLVGIDVSQIDETHDGITWINHDGSLEKEENRGMDEDEDEDLNRLLTDKNVQ